MYMCVSVLPQHSRAHLNDDEAEAEGESWGHACRSANTNNIELIQTSLLLGTASVLRNCFIIVTKSHTIKYYTYEINKYTLFNHATFRSVKTYA